MSPSSRMRAWGAAVSAVHAALGLAGWILLGIAPWFFGGCALVTLAGALAAAPLMRPRRDEGGDDGPGGAGAPEDPEPPWWPEFERGFRDYADGHLTAR